MRMMGGRSNAVPTNAHMYTCVRLLVPYSIYMPSSGFISLLRPLLNNLQDGLLFELYIITYDVTFLYRCKITDCSC